MDTLECYTSEEAINNETGFTIIQPQLYQKLPDHLQSQGNLISESNLESKMGPKQTAQISEPPQWGKSSLKFVMIRDAEEEK